MCKENTYAQPLTEDKADSVEQTELGPPLYLPLGVGSNFGLIY